VLGARSDMPGPLQGVQAVESGLWVAGPSAAELKESGAIPWRKGEKMREAGLISARFSQRIEADASGGRLTPTPKGRYGNTGSFVCPPFRAVGGRPPGPLRDGRILRSRPAPLAAIPPAVLNGGQAC